MADWKVHDTLKWLNDIELSRLIRKVLPLGLTGRHLLSLSENELISRLQIEDDEEVSVQCTFISVKVLQIIYLLIDYYMTCCVKIISLQAVDILKKQLYWLKREDCNIMENIDESEIPHEFLCPITHEIMKEPVQCSGKKKKKKTNQVHNTSSNNSFFVRKHLYTQNLYLCLLTNNSIICNYFQL